MPEEQSVHARDGVADPHGCGNPLRSGIVGLSAAPDSQPPAIFPTRLSHLKQHAHPLKATPKSQQERPAVPEEQSVHARDGVADPHGCGNPLRSGIVGLSAAPDSQPPAIFPTRLSHLKQHAHPLKATPKSQQERPAVPEEQSVHARDGVADPHGCGNPLRSGIVGLSAAPNSQPPATSLQQPASSLQPPALSSLLLPHHTKKNGRPGFP